MIAYKFLSAGAYGLFSRFAWPAPSNGTPGEWVHADGELEPCLNGVHACADTTLVDWLDEELWEVELEGDVLEAEGTLVAPAGRLVRRVEGWNGDCARRFTDYCVDTAVALAAESLARAGHESDAEALAASRSRPDAEQHVLELARRFEHDPSSPVLFLADVTRLERGGRPDLDAGLPPPEEGGPTPSAIAANVGFVCAHIAASLAEQEAAGAYGARFAAERQLQSDWLAGQIKLPLT